VLTNQLTLALFVSMNPAGVGMQTWSFHHLVLLVLEKNWQKLAKMMLEGMLFDRRRRLGMADEFFTLWM
jgi:hypothetical protein